MVNAFKNKCLVQISTRPYGKFIPLPEDEAIALRDFEKKAGVIVYMVLRAVTLYGTLDSCLFVGCAPDNWKNERDELKEGCTDTYTINRESPSCSELGYIDFKHTQSRGLVRTDIDFF